MKYKILIVTANYYSDISNNLTKKAKLFLKNKAVIKIILADLVVVFSERI